MKFNCDLENIKSSWNDNRRVNKMFDNEKMMEISVEENWNDFINQTMEDFKNIFIFVCIQY